jgi:hypothetical protein
MPFQEVCIVMHIVAWSRIQHNNCLFQLFNELTAPTSQAMVGFHPYTLTPTFLKSNFNARYNPGDTMDFFLKQNCHGTNQSSMKQGNSVRNYHAQLCKVLQSFTTVGPQLTNVSLPIWPIMCILFLIQDMQEGDVLCGRCDGTHGSGIQRHRRACNVDHTNLDNPDVKFSRR